MEAKKKKSGEEKKLTAILKELKKQTELLNNIWTERRT
ncbi:hypothetical protein LCGC14_0369510 [marine sediment metagenome]|uniref:Uncharacterized protein n=1 Tax=marine sediment metagenome TaxID=412755 RepID=A0A0F9TNE4_9ZZZZ